MSITVQDHITVKSTDLSQVKALFESEYLCGAKARGLSLQSFEVSPPVVTVGGNSSVWIRWSLDDVAAFWAMRAQSGCEEVYRFWQQVDAICLSRRRSYLSEFDEQALAAATQAAAPSQITRYRLTAQLELREDSNTEPLKAVLDAVPNEVPGVLQSALAANLAPEYAAGHFTWDLLFDDEAAAREAQASAYWQQDVCEALNRHCNAVHAMALEHIEGGVLAPDMSGGVKRTAYFRLLPSVDVAEAQRFERDLLEMPQHIAAIRNWRLSKAVPVDWSTVNSAPWSYVWEQDFADLDGLLGPYMEHPHHWSHVDRHFDFESGEQIVDAQLSHAFSFFSSSVLAQESLA